MKFLKILSNTFCMLNVIVLQMQISSDDAVYVLMQKESISKISCSKVHLFFYSKKLLMWFEFAEIYAIRRE